MPGAKLAPRLHAQINGQQMQSCSSGEEMVIWRVNLQYDNKDERKCRMQFYKHDNFLK
jgi:hypothetical protein